VCAISPVKNATVPSLLPDRPRTSDFRVVGRFCGGTQWFLLAVGGSPVEAQVAAYLHATAIEEATDGGPRNRIVAEWKLERWAGKGGRWID
jgi:hypothetical protein